MNVEGNVTANASTIIVTSGLRVGGNLVVPGDRSGRVGETLCLIDEGRFPEARERLEEALAVSVTVDNDANLAAYGEQWLGSGRGVSRLSAAGRVITVTR